MENLKILKEKLIQSNRVVFFTGAGISAESGIPTFRGKDGLWNRYSPTELATLDAFIENPVRVWQWYLFRMRLIAKAEPNSGHLAISEFERLLRDVWVITQNVDGLHFRAGSKRVIELHGNIFRGKCRFCGKEYSEKEFSSIFPFSGREVLKGMSDDEFNETVLKNFTKDVLPVCKVCGEIVGPGVVWFGEILPEEAVEKAFEISSACEFFFSIGTSAVVQPAALLPIYAKRGGAFLVEINLEETSLSSICDAVFRDSAGKVLSLILNEVKKG
ncbi:SIR2 family NAD-dependent protein deacylase [Desulfurobacterium atlanticum]|uniref:NAD-dependent protein deacylase n=1 Tax=Desulfurobacterium atlanticum TaxID=240169 RepID=A0A238YQC2_9BACT|nr:NAD-dependent deacylase [Desulfurobacterium atlanticum]SNR73476.1 NAD-dependent deacetylase [Desulfurobacterium atlanticum]